MLKFGAISTPTSECPAVHSFTRARRSSSNPVVPTTQCIPAPMANSRFPITASGVVKSMTTSHDCATNSSRESPMSMAAANSIPGAADTASTTAAPMRPRAPVTPTRRGADVVMASSLRACRKAKGGADHRSTPPSRSCFG